MDENSLFMTHPTLVFDQESQFLLLLAERVNRKGVVNHCNPGSRSQDCVWHWSLPVLRQHNWSGSIQDRCFYLLVVPPPSSIFPLLSAPLPTSLPPSLGLCPFLSFSRYLSTYRKRGHNTLLCRIVWSPDSVSWASVECLWYSGLCAGPVPLRCRSESSAAPIPSMRRLWPDSQSWYVAEPESGIRSSGSSTG